MKARRRAVALILCGAIALLLARALLPIWLRDHVNRVLDGADAYGGRVADVDVALLRGAYRMEGVEIHKEGGRVPVPFFTAERIDLSIEWRALYHGALAGEVEIERATLNFVAGPTRAQQQTGTEENWARRLERLFPFDFDRVAVRESQLHFVDPHREPRVDIALHDVTIEARNLTNSRDLSARRPAQIDMRARAQRSGRVAAEVSLNPFAEVPDGRLRLEVASLQLPELNDFLRAYVGVDAERGRFDLVSEVVSEGGRFEGYVEPLLQDVDVLRIDEEADEQSIFATLWEAVVGATAELLENQPEDQLATRIPLSGTYPDPDLGFWGALLSLIENGYVEALRPRIELLRERSRG